eukprot:s983_g11.t1
MEALQLLQGWTTALWGEPTRLLEQTDLEATIPWDPPTAAPAPTEDEMETLNPSRPTDAAGDPPRREKPEGMDSWDTEELPGTDTEEEAWGLTRRRRRRDPLPAKQQPRNLRQVATGCIVTLRGPVASSDTPDGSDVAIKAIDLSVLMGKGECPEDAGFEDEVTLLSKFRHPHLVTLLGWGQHCLQRFLVYEFLSGGDVFQRLHKCHCGQQGFPWHDRLSVLLDAASGLSHMHNATPKAFHRDIKSANILLDRHGTAKMADFGVRSKTRYLRRLSHAATLSLQVEHGSMAAMAAKRDILRARMAELLRSRSLPKVTERSSLELVPELWAKVVVFLDLRSRGALAPCAQRMAPEPLTKLELHGGQARAFSALLSCSARQHLKVLDVRLQGLSSVAISHTPSLEELRFSVFSLHLHV